MGQDKNIARQEEELTEQEITFVRYYFACGQKPSEKVDMYRLAFPEKEHVSDDSVEVYARDILRLKQAKQILAELDGSNQVVLNQYVHWLKEMNDRLNSDDKEDKMRPSEEAAYRREMRQTARELNSFIHPTVIVDTNPGKRGTSFTLNIIEPKKCVNCGYAMTYDSGDVFE